MPRRVVGLEETERDRQQDDNPCSISARGNDARDERRVRFDASRYVGNEINPLPNAVTGRAR